MYNIVIHNIHNQSGFDTAGSLQSVSIIVHCQRDLCGMLCISQTVLVLCSWEGNDNKSITSYHQDVTEVTCRPTVSTV